MPTVEYAILRVGKLTGWSKVTNANKHNLRLRDTPNADPAKTKMNRLLVGTTDLKAAAKARFLEMDVKPARKTTTLVSEVILTASPEAFKRPDFDMDEWVTDNVEWLKEKFKDNLIQAVLHLDERTPHIHAMVTPILNNGKENKLIAKHFWGEAKGLKALQTEYAKVVEGHGLKRGIEKSKARHETIKDYYTNLNKAEKVNKMKEPDMPRFEKINPPRYGGMVKGDKTMEELTDFNRAYRKSWRQQVHECWEIIKSLTKRLRESEKKLEEQKKLTTQYVDKTDWLRRVMSDVKRESAQAMETMARLVKYQPEAFAKLNAQAIAQEGQEQKQRMERLERQEQERAAKIEAERAASRQAIAGRFSDASRTSKRPAPPTHSRNLTHPSF